MQSVISKAAEVQFEAHAEEIKERISGLKQQSTCQLVLPGEVNRDKLFKDEEILSIHNSIHVCFSTVFFFIPPM
jgi:hypothetical protein